VDRSHALPQDYVPGDLVPLSADDVPTVGGRGLMLRREAAEHLKNLVAAAAADSEELVVASAFRSYVDQQTTYGRLKSIYGPGADAMSAAPGHSQHQLGTAVDFTNAAAGYQVQPIFGHTGAAWWLRDHAPEYGFVLSYPPGKDGTGYSFEPWHYRYIGVQNAGRLERSGLTLQEFLLRESCPTAKARGEAGAAVVELWDDTSDGSGTRRRSDGDGVPAVRRGARVFPWDIDRVLLVLLRAQPRRAKAGP
jgi:D-alanyl-D-alanine carboxypeptidase